MTIDSGEQAMSARTVFMFSGQGSQYYQMGRQLFDEHPVFREWMVWLDGVAHGINGRRVLDAIYSADKSEVFDRTLLTHPAIFMVEYALAQCLIHEGIKPDLTLGTSLGSFAAAAVAGYIGVEDALAAVLEQAAAFEASCERGGMIAVLADPALYDEDFLYTRSEMAGINFSSHFAVSAAQCELPPIEAALKQRNVTYQRLAVSFAYHSRWIEGAEAQFAEFMRSIPLGRGGLPLVCCAQGQTLTDLSDGFFWRVVRQPIRFRDAVAHLERQGRHRYIDVGPSGTLATFVKYGLPAMSSSSAHPVLTPYGQDRKNLAALLATLPATA
ncbi:acyltransferase domain-containing protein [Chitiniphilus purpureus]|uniref:Acyltransferase domain-containing protein n=1 Tax=Chitiniphilus purpureus TaxID=2981137 RepID=A0ABY6DP99_9NEIS|nr:acyltransferase domain-containing protein [Chitiniphilus sp. CD1]UXY16197.1 acyltransferase domain-containing protein [Chitiniphilus sp. CD1]